MFVTTCTRTIEIQLTVLGKNFLSNALNLFYDICWRHLYGYFIGFTPQK